jgi:hypothetical protein
MNLTQHLIDGDPVAREPELDTFHADAMRQRMLVEAKQPPAAAPLWWLSPIAVAVAVAACLLVAIGIGVRMNSDDVTSPYVAWRYVGRPFPPSPRLRRTAEALAEAGQGRRPSPVSAQSSRQLQFATPGGTRIIWTFHQEFDL